jgi:hypothetical protein
VLPFSGFGSHAKKNMKRTYAGPLLFTLHDSALQSGRCPINRQVFPVSAKASLRNGPYQGHAHTGSVRHFCASFYQVSQNPA